MKNIELSFIIPIFNNDPRVLIRCLFSIEKLERVNYEVIGVDDGSDENLSEKYKKIFNNNFRFRYFKQKNTGPSGARNLGLRFAKGRFVFFLDADDEINSGPLDKFNYNLFNDELIIFDVKAIYSKKNRFSPSKNIQLFSIKKFNDFLIQDKLLNLFMNNGIMNWAVAKLYSKKFLQKNNLFFDENQRVGEDWDFVIRTVLCKPHIKYIPQVVYVYYLNPDNGINRILKYPLISIRNAISMYKRKNYIADKNSLSENVKDEIGKNAIDTIFEIYCTLIVNKISLTQEQKNMFYKSIKYVLPNNCNFLTKIKVKLMLKNQYKITILYVQLKKLYRFFKPYRF